MDDHITHLLAAGPNTDPAQPRVPIGRLPLSLGLMLSGIDGLRPVSLDVIFYDTVNGDVTAGVMLGPIRGGRGIVPQGWIARFYLITMQTIDDGADITAASGAMFVDGVDASADWNALATVPLDNASVFADATPLFPPFTIDASAARMTYDMRITTNGTAAGAILAMFHVMGFMYKAV